jgi:hypothetical protein
MTTRVKVDPEPVGRLTADSDAVVTRTDRFPIKRRALLAYLGQTSDAADEMVIAVQIQERAARATTPGYWTPLEDVIRDHGRDPADFGLE